MDRIGRPTFEFEDAGMEAGEAAPVPRKLFDAVTVEQRRGQLALAEVRLMIKRADGVYKALLRLDTYVQSAYNFHGGNDLVNLRRGRYQILSDIYGQLRSETTDIGVNTPQILGRILFLERSLDIREEVLRDAPAQRGAMADHIPALEGDNYDELARAELAAIVKRWERIVEHVGRLADRAEDDYIKGEGQVPDQERLLLQMILETFADIDVTDVDSKPSLLLLEEVLGIKQPGNLRQGERQTERQTRGG